MLGVGVVTLFVKNSKTSPTAAPTESPTIVVTSTPTETVSATPSTTGMPSQEPSPTNSMKKEPADQEGNAGQTPHTGVGWHPFGFVLVLLAGVTGLWIRRAART